MNKYKGELPRMNDDVCKTSYIKIPIKYDSLKEDDIVYYSNLYAYFQIKKIGDELLPVCLRSSGMLIEDSSTKGTLLITKGTILDLNMINVRDFEKLVETPYSIQCRNKKGNENMAQKIEESRETLIKQIDLMRQAINLSNYDDKEDLKYLIKKLYEALKRDRVMKYRIVNISEDINYMNDNVYVLQNGDICHDGVIIQKYTDDNKKMFVERFSGYVDMNGNELFENDEVWFEMFRSDSFVVTNTDDGWMFKNDRKQLPMFTHHELAIKSQNMCQDMYLSNIGANDEN